MKRTLLLVLLRMIVSVFPAYAQTGENLVKNGDFSIVDEFGMPEGWTTDMWLKKAGASMLSVVGDGYDANSIRIESVEANDARFMQQIDVEPDSLYYFSAMVRAEGCSETAAGASLSIRDTFVYSTQVHNSYGEWEKVELYGRTDKDQTSLTLMARVGGYSSVNTGIAYFDDISMVRIDEAPSGAMVQSLKEVTSSAAVSQNAKADDEPARNTPMYLLLTAIYAVAMLALARRFLRIDGARINARVLLVLGFAAAIAARIVTALLVRGYYVDLNCFSGWSERIYTVGITDFYSPDYFCDYPPGYMLMLWPVSLLRRLLGLQVQSMGHILLLKTLPMVCDILAAWLVYRLARRMRLSDRLSAVLALVYALNPAAIADSAAWGQMDSILALLIALCALYAADGKYIRSLSIFAAALLVKPQALLFAPLGLVAIVIDLVCGAPVGKSIRCESAEEAKGSSRDKLLRSLEMRKGRQARIYTEYEYRRDPKKIVHFLIGVGAALGIIYAVGFLFTIGKANGFADALIAPVKWLYELYSGTLDSYSYITLNALNLYTLFDMNWKATSAVPVWTIVAWCLFALSYLYSFFLYFKARDPKKIFLVGGVLLAMIYAFGPKIHERYFFPALLLLTLAYACDRDRRIFFSMVAMSAISALNIILVLQGGMTQANYGHLQSSEQWLNELLSLGNVLNTLYLAYTALSICVFKRVKEFKAPDEWELRPEKPRDHRLHLKRRDWLWMTFVTLVYSVVTFANLGTTAAPQTGYISTQAGEQVIVDLGGSHSFRMIYYGGICDTSFTVEFSNDGKNWSEPANAKYDQGHIFRWLYFAPVDSGMEVIYRDVADSADGSAVMRYATVNEDFPLQRARYVRLTAKAAGLKMMEIGFWSPSGNLLRIKDCELVHANANVPDWSVQYANFENDPALLFDEQHTVPETPSYYNSTYFDEIYHARTAYEMLHGEYAYEWTHPPLGKAMMMLGVAIFGMSPYGWRFMGAMVGVLMVPLMYLLIKQLTKSTKLSVIGMLLMALDSMHFTQTRIATIDSYAVFWIMLMYLFMFRYAQMDFNRQKLYQTLIPLGLCGITMGIAWATKWVGIYGSVGLAVIFFWTLIRRYMDHRALLSAGGDSRFWGKCAATVAFCLVFFVVIPVLTYHLSYYWHLKSEGVKNIFDMFSSRWIERVVGLQEDIFKYHAGLGGDTHYFRSEWYEWPVIWWPMWYYSGAKYVPDGMVSSISCMGNPAVWWMGLAALIFVIIRGAYKRRMPKVWLMVLIGFASQYLPWVLVPRSTFIYHYFASVPFIIICTVLMLGSLKKRSREGFYAVSIALVTAAAVLFAAFYPLESGLPVAREYAMLLRWFKWYNF